jgi:hypothetical protein
MNLCSYDIFMVPIQIIIYNSEFKNVVLKKRKYLSMNSLPNEHLDWILNFEYLFVVITYDS